MTLPVNSGAHHDLRLFSDTKVLSTRIMSISGETAIRPFITRISPLGFRNMLTSDS